MTSLGSPVSSPPANPRDTIYVIGNLLGVVSIVFGGLGLVIGLIPLFGVAGLGLVFPGFILGVVGGVMLYIGRRGSLKLPIIGVIVCVVAVVVCIAINVVLVAISAASGGY